MRRKQTTYSFFINKTVDAIVVVVDIWLDQLAYLMHLALLSYRLTIVSKIKQQHEMNKINFHTFLVLVIYDNFFSITF